jgi:hypothetical protein
MNTFSWILIGISIFIILTLLARIKRRGYFWKSKLGEKLTVKQFFKKWGEGIEGVTPRQQALTNFICVIPIIAGLIWGIAVTFLGGAYWMVLILVFSLPITAIQGLNAWQKYKKHRAVEEAMKNIAILRDGNKLK